MSLRSYQLLAVAAFVSLLGCGDDPPPPTDSGTVDSAVRDSGNIDAGALPDASTMDAAADASRPDAGGADATTPDAAAPDAGADAATPDSGVMDLYAACSGTPFYPTTCPGESCVDAGLERRVYDIWREQFMAIHSLSAAEMDARIVVSDVAIADGPLFVFWRVDYVFVLDWVRSRQSESVRLGSFPLPTPPTDPEIESAVDFAIESAEQFDLPAVAPLVDVLGKMDDCRPGMQINYCNLNFVNVTGELVIRGIVPIGGGQCANARVDVGAGMLLRCFEQPCAIM